MRNIHNYNNEWNQENKNSDESNEFKRKLKAFEIQRKIISKINDETNQAALAETLKYSSTVNEIRKQAEKRTQIVNEIIDLIVKNMNYFIRTYNAENISEENQVRYIFNRVQELLVEFHAIFMTKGYFEYSGNNKSLLQTLSQLESIGLICTEKQRQVDFFEKEKRIIHAKATILGKAILNIYKTKSNEQPTYSKIKTERIQYYHQLQLNIKE